MYDTLYSKILEKKSDTMLKLFDGKKNIYRFIVTKKKPSSFKNTYMTFHARMGTRMPTTAVSMKGPRATEAKTLLDQLDPTVVLSALLDLIDTTLMEGQVLLPNAPIEWLVSIGGRAILKIGVGWEVGQYRLTMDDRMPRPLADTIESFFAPYVYSIQGHIYTYMGVPRETWYEFMHSNLRQYPDAVLSLQFRPSDALIRAVIDGILLGHCDESTRRLVIEASDEPLTIAYVGVRIVESPSLIACIVTYRS